MNKCSKCETCQHNTYSNYPNRSLICSWCNCGDQYMEKKQLHYVSARGGGRSILDGLMVKHWHLDVHEIIPSIDKVIFNDPATIVMWSDGTKTVVKAEGEDFDEEKGLAMAISKKALGNQGNYYEEFKKWIPEEKKRPKKMHVGVISTQNVEETIAKIFGEPVPKEDKEESEILPCGCNKSVCAGNCGKCCPAHTGNKRNAGPGCKSGCSIYDRAFK